MTCSKETKFALQLSTQHNCYTLQATMSQLMSCIFTRKPLVENFEPSKFAAYNLLYDGKVWVAPDDNEAVTTSNSVTYADIRRQHIANISIFLRGSQMLKNVSIPHKKSEEFFDTLLEDGNVTAAKT